MAKAGDELVNPVTGLRTVFRKTAQDTSGELLQVDWISEPGWTTGPDHVHPRQEERFEVQRVILGALARVARLLGYRAEYPYPHARQSEVSRTLM